MHFFKALSHSTLVSALFGYLKTTVDPLWHDKWPPNAKRQICMRLCVALDWTGPGLDWAGLGPK